MPISPTRLFELILESGLRTSEAVEQIRAEANWESSAEDPAAALAEELVRRQVLTAFQAQVLLQELPHPLVFGKNVAIDRIGGGGMGEVFLAMHAVMERQVAVKVLKTNLLNSRESIERFHREVRAAARLQHPHIVTAYDAGEASGHHYLAMEYVDGFDLARLARKEQLPIDRALDYIQQAARGMEYAHSQGVIHRDIKPANLLCNSRGVVKVLDLGIARVKSAENTLCDETVEHLTVSGMMMGTVDFMAPEQALNSTNADARSDIYSLGCSLFSLITSRPAYTGNSVIEKIFAHRGEPIPQFDQTLGKPAALLNQLLNSMLAKDPEDRLQSMGDVVAAIEECRKHAVSPTFQVSFSNPTLVGELDGGTVAENGDTYTKPTEPFGPEYDAMVELLEKFIAGRGFRDRFINLSEEDEILRKGCDEGLEPEAVRDFMRHKCKQENWTILSDLSPALLSLLQQAGEQGGVARDSFNQVVGHAASCSMPRKEAIEHCLTLMLDHSVPVADEEWFDKLLERYGL